MIVSPEDFVASISYDHRLAPFDLTASAAHAEMLARRKIISPSEGARLVAGLKKLQKQISSGKKLPKAEDIHFAIEKAMFQTVGPAAGKLHTARSRNDQVVTALRLYLRKHIDDISEKLAETARAFVESAEKYFGAVMPGFTHLQPGQPVLVSHHLLAHAWALQRDRERLADVRRRVNVLPLGAAALAGTSFPIDRNWVAKKLGFEGVVPNSMDAVSDRDFLVEFLAAASLISVHLSRFAEELVIWSNPCFGYVTLAKEFVTGSSIMPQKKNPDTAELLRGKTGRVVGSLIALLVNLKSQPLAYNRDLQEDKPPVFDAVETVEGCLDVTAPMIRTMSLNVEKMEASCRWGYLLATDVADALTRRGMSFRQAHGVMAAVVDGALSSGKNLEDLSLKEWKKHSDVFDAWVFEILSVKKAVASRNSSGGTAPSEVKRRISILKKRLQ